MLHVSVFLRYTLVLGIDGFHSLPSSIRVTFLGHTHLAILQSLQILQVFGVFNSCSFHLHGKILFIPNGLSCLISCLLGVVSLVESSCGQKGKRYGLTKREYLNKTRKRREVKDLFEKESFLRKSFLWACQFLGSRPTVNMCSDTIL